MDFDAKNIHTFHDDTVVNYDARQILIDNRNYADIIFYNIFSKMNFSRDRLQKTGSPLIEFSGDTVSVEGMVTLPFDGHQLFIKNNSNNGPNKLPKEDNVS